LAALFAKEAFADGMPVSTLLAARFALAALAFWLIVAWRRPVRPSARTVLRCVGLGAAGYALQSACYFGALTRLNASVVAQLLYVYPALVLIIALVRRQERASRTKFIALGCSGVGLLLLLNAGGAGPMPTAGVLLALGAAVTYALYITAAGTLPKDLDVYLLSAIVCTAAAASISAFGLTTGALRPPSQAAGWLWLAGLAFVPTVVAVSTFLAGMRLVGGSVAAILSCVEPVVTAGSAWLVYGEKLGPAQLLGAAAVLAAVVVLQADRFGPRAQRHSARRVEVSPLMGMAHPVEVGVQTES
jgi:drug/metabolite transporter (DMT)-like permease